MSTIKERVDNILSRPMTRQQFLKQLGLLLLAAVGITNIINTFDKHTGKQGNASADNANAAYGAAAYAGGKKPV